METDINDYLVDSIKRFQIKKLGYMPESRMPFVILENDLVFYGLPGRREKILEDILNSLVEIVKDLEYRYFQRNRRLKQHSKYRYKSGDVVVELGAYLGFYSMYAAQRVGPRGRVISVELIPENYKVLKMNLSTNYPENTVAINLGVHKEKGIRPAYLGRSQIAGFRKDVIARYAPDIQKINLEMDTVDNILQENNTGAVDLMIIQVNGNEIDVLKGMPQSIQAVRNFAIAAPYDSNAVDHKRYISEFLTENGFDVDVDSPWIYASNAD